MGSKKPTLSVNSKVDGFKAWAESHGWLKVGEEYYEKTKEIYLCFVTPHGNVILLSGEDNVVTDVRVQS